MGERKYSTNTLNRLRYQSMNCCSFPSCQNSLLTELGKFNGNVCHIEAFSPGGPRYNSDPQITNKDRNSYNNLMLLCRDHHGIIDEKDEDKNPVYSSEQLRAMKQSHIDMFNKARNATLMLKGQSLLGKIVNELAEYQEFEPPLNKNLPFEVENKISFNQISFHHEFIKDHAAYRVILVTLYDRLDTRQMKVLLQSVRNFYTRFKNLESSDYVIDKVVTAMMDFVRAECNFQYSEELEWCINIIVVDGFMRCKILEEPKEEAL